MDARVGDGLIRIFEGWGSEMGNSNLALRVVGLGLGPGLLAGLMDGARVWIASFGCRRW